MTPKQAFGIMYGESAAGDATVECQVCGECLLGDGPTIPVVCVPCLSKYRKGVMTKERCVCFKCAVLDGDDFANSTPVTRSTHPDGFTCDCCG